MNTKTHYVYIYCDPRKKGVFIYDDIDYVFNYEPFYVGEGKGYRYKRHITNYEMEWNYNTIKNGKIKSILNEGYDLSKYVVFYKEKIDKIEALEIEIFLIEKMGRLNKNNGILSNLTDGGDGWSGAVSPFKGKTYDEIHGLEKSIELKEKRKIALIGNNYGTLQRGKKLSDEHKKKISDFRKKEVKQLDKNFKLIKVWKSPTDAAIELEINVGLIHNVLGKSMKNISAGGFYWEYINEENIKYNKLKNK
jgi:hypothetical protein